MPRKRELPPSNTPSLPPPANRLGNRDALDETFAKAHGEVEFLRRQGALVAYRLGERLTTIITLQLYKEGGFKNGKEYLRSLKGASVRTYERCMERYDAIPKTLAEKLEAERIDLAAALLPHKKGKTPTITEEALDALEVTVKRDGCKVKVPFHDAATDELQEAARLRKPKEATPRAVVDGAARIARKLGQGSAAIADVKPRKSGSRHGLQIFVPEDRIDEFEKLFKPAKG